MLDTLRSSIKSATIHHGRQLLQFRPLVNRSHPNPAPSSKLSSLQTTVDGLGDKIPNIAQIHATPKDIQGSHNEEAPGT